jgi:uncharacterized membrane protein (UPF0127 family)
MTRRALLAVVVLAGATLVGCGDDGDAGPDLSPPDIDALSGNAPAAQGAGLDAPPGPADRLALDSFDVGDLEFGEVAIAITGPDGEVAGWCVLLAATSEQRQRGLMEVTDLGGYAGMLFVWDGDASSSFYMRNTPTPLSIGWFDADGALVSTADMDPCPDVQGCPTYPSGGSYRFALEVPQGSLAAAWQWAVRAPRGPSGPSRKSSWRLAGQIRRWTSSSSSPQPRLRLPPASSPATNLTRRYIPGTSASTH